MQAATLDVVIVDGKLRDTELWGDQSPYVTVELAGQKQKSRVCNAGGEEPVWHERLTFIKVDPAAATDMVVRVWAKCTFNDKEIGAANVRMARVYAGGCGCEELRVPLQTHKGKPGGELRLMFIWHPAQGAGGATAGAGFQQPGGFAQPPAPVFTQPQPGGSFSTACPPSPPLSTPLFHPQPLAGYPASPTAAPSAPPMMAPVAGYPPAPAVAPGSPITLQQPLQPQALGSYGSCCFAASAASTPQPPAPQAQPAAMVAGYPPLGAAPPPLPYAPQQAVAPPSRGPYQQPACERFPSAFPTVSFSSEQLFPAQPAFPQRDYAQQEAAGEPPPAC